MECECQHINSELSCEKWCLFWEFERNMEDFLRLSTEEIVTRLGSDNVLWKLWSQKVITSEELEIVQNLRLRENRRKLISVLLNK